MLAVKTGLSSLTDVLKHGNIEVAYINSLMETVLGGASAAIDVAKNVFDARGMEATKLNVSPRRRGRRI